MVDTNKGDKLDSEIAKRLDDLFGDGDSSSDDYSTQEADDPIEDEGKFADQPPPDTEDDISKLEEPVENKSEAEKASADAPLSELKNMVLSIDWEITDEVLSGFLSQIDILKQVYKTEKIELMFLQILGSLGEYIKTNRGKAHPKTFKVLNSVFARLEDVVLSEDMADSEKKKLLQVELKKYKQLRKHVAQKKATSAGRGKAKPIKMEKSLLRAPKKKPDVIPEKALAAAKEENPISDSIAAKSHDSLAEVVEELKEFIRAEISVLRQEIRMLKKSR